MTDDPVERLRRDYTPAFLAHLSRRDESTRSSAYELGRAALAAHLGMLDLVLVHHTVFLQVAEGVGDLDELRTMIDAAAVFLLEALAPFQMTQVPRPRVPADPHAVS